MGIKHLSKLIKQYAPSGVKNMNVSKLKNKILAIDASQTIYQYVLAIRNNGKDLNDKDGNMTSHLYAIFNKTFVILSKGAKPVFIFDGKPTPLKDTLLEERKKIKDKSENPFSITPEIIKDCQKLLDIMKIPYIMSIEEADPQCAYLCNEEVVDYSNSDDLDLLAFGSPNVVRTIRGASETVEKYDLEKILDELDITYDQFIDVCILLGCDYCRYKIKGLGLKKVLPFIKEHKSIEGILEWLDEEPRKGFKVDKEFRKKYKKARLYFQKPVIIRKKEIKLKWKEPDTLELFKYLWKKNFNPSIIKKRISDYWKFWCNIFDDSNRNKDLFPGVKFKSKPQKDPKSSVKSGSSSESDIELITYKKKYELQEKKS